MLDKRRLIKCLKGIGNVDFTMMRYGLRMGCKVIKENVGIEKNN